MVVRDAGIFVCIFEFTKLHNSPVYFDGTSEGRSLYQTRNEKRLGFGPFMCDSANTTSLHKGARDRYRGWRKGLVLYDDGHTNANCAASSPSSDERRDQSLESRAILRPRTYTEALRSEALPLSTATRTTYAAQELNGLRAVQHRWPRLRADQQIRPLPVYPARKYLVGLCIASFVSPSPPICTSTKTLRG